jgi:hypothetical protein
LHTQSVDEVRIHYFVEGAEDLLSKHVGVQFLKTEIVELYRVDEGHFNFEVDEVSCKFEFDGSDFYLTYPQKFEKEFAVFDEELE